MNAVCRAAGAVAGVAAAQMGSSPCGTGYGHGMTNGYPGAGPGMMSDSMGW
ncbi:MAG: hypothetical protein KGL20_03670 [Rhodospirillales bacterium]|nr:hypothetical protein [Rhodospirillales bacterium]